MHRLLDLLGISARSPLLFISEYDFCFIQVKYSEREYSLFMLQFLHVYGSSES